MAKAKLTRQEEQQIKKEAEDKRKKLIDEKVKRNQKIQTEYDKVIDLLRQSVRKLKDDEVSELHEKLKKFFNTNSI